MFFIRSVETGQESAPEPEIVAHLTFKGEPSGSLTLSVAAGAARSVAADFLGEEEPALSEQQIGEVVCELANMICGSVLSRVESAITFQLATPRIVASASATEGRTNPGLGAAPSSTADAEHSTVHAIETCGGSMVVMINTETSPWA